MRSVLIQAAAIPGTLDCVSLQALAVEVREYDLSWGGKSDNFSQNGGLVSDTSVGVATANPAPLGRTSLLPGTIAQSSGTPLKPGHNSAFSVEPDHLPSWMTNQPLAYLRYGAAPAVVTLHFGHK